MALKNLTPAEIAAKYAKNAASAVSDYKKGVENVTVAPGKKAAKSVAKMRQNILAAIDDGKWASRVGSVSLEDWKAKAAGKGADRYPTGVRDAEGKMAAFMGEFMPFQATIQSELSAMPNLTLEDNINRAAHQIRRASEFKRSTSNRPR